MVIDDLGRERSHSGGMRISLIISYVALLFGWGLVGVIIAYVQRSNARGTLWETHVTYIVRTFWLTILVGIICVGAIAVLVHLGSAPSFGRWLLMAVMFVAMAIWHLIRVIKGLLKAINYEPIPDPETWGI